MDMLPNVMDNDLRAVDDAIRDYWGMKPLVDAQKTQVIHMNLKVNEQLAVLTALQKAVKTKLDEVRAEADADMLDAFDEDGVTKKALKLGGVKASDYIVVLASDDFMITDADAFNGFALTYGFASQKMSIKPECMEQAIKDHRGDGPVFAHRGSKARSQLEETPEQLGRDCDLSGFG